MAFCPPAENTMFAVPGEIPLTVNLAFPDALVTVSGVIVATVGEVLTAVVFIPKSGPPSLSII